LGHQKKFFRELRQLLSPAAPSSQAISPNNVLPITPPALVTSTLKSPKSAAPVVRSSQQSQSPLQSLQTGSYQAFDFNQSNIFFCKAD
jgi:hypothetical protein